MHNADGQTYIDFDLSMSCAQSGYLAPNLQVRLEFYQNGIMRVAIDQPDSTRFRISGEDLPVEWDQLKGVDQEKFAEAFKLTEDGFSVTGLTRDDDENDNSVYDYHVTLSPFGIRQMTNGELTSSTYGQVYFENMSVAKDSTNEDTCFDALKSRAQTRSGSDIYDNEPGTVKQAVSMSFYLPGEEQTLYGIPEREDTLALKTTTGTDPYQMFATDHLHAPNEVGPLYGSVPYIMGLSDKAATSFLWVNSAKTTVDIDRPEEVPADVGKKGAQVTFASEANVIEFFMFTSSA